MSPCEGEQMAFKIGIIKESKKIKAPEGASTFHTLWGHVSDGLNKFLFELVM